MELSVDQGEKRIAIWLIKNLSGIENNKIITTSIRADIFPDMFNYSFSIFKSEKVRYSIVVLPPTSS